VKNFNYLGYIFNADNKMNIEIAERIAKGNKAYYANTKQIKSKFIMKNTKMKTNKMTIPVVRYSSETSTLIAKDVKNLSIFESKYYGTYLVLSILTIYGAYETTWRKIN